MDRTVLRSSGLPVYSSFAPSGTSPSGTHNVTSPRSLWKPVTRHSDQIGPICFDGKFTTPTTSFPTSSSTVYSAVTCALDFFTPSSGPKST